MLPFASVSSLFFFNDTATTEIYTLSLHDALPIFLVGEEKATPPARTSEVRRKVAKSAGTRGDNFAFCVPSASPSFFLNSRSEEHTSELQSPCNLVCRLLLEKKKKRASWQPDRTEA